MDETEKYVKRKMESLTHYAIKYNINTLHLTRLELLKKIHSHEMNHIKHLADKGNDPETNEIGFFIQS
jgi:hypothetical protein